MPCMAKKRPKTVTRYIRLPEKLLEVIEALADEHDRRTPDEIALALKEFAEKHGRWPLPENKSK